MTNNAREEVQDEYGIDDETLSEFGQRALDMAHGMQTEVDGERFIEKVQVAAEEVAMDIISELDVDDFSEQDINNIAEAVMIEAGYYPEDI